MSLSGIIYHSQIYSSRRFEWPVEAHVTKFINNTGTALGTLEAAVDKTNSKVYLRYIHDLNRFVTISYHFGICIARCLCFRNCSFSAQDARMSY